MGCSTSTPTPTSEFYTSEFVDWYVECMLLVNSSPPLNIKHNKYHMLLMHLLIQVKPTEFTYEHYNNKSKSTYNSKHIDYWDYGYTSFGVRYLHYFGSDIGGLCDELSLGPGYKPPLEVVIISKFYHYSSLILDLSQEKKGIRYIGWNCARLTERINHKLHLMHRDDLQFRV
jgi:hypothetical protein